MDDRQLRIFAGTDLAERIESAERTLILEATEAAARRNPGSAAFATRIAGGVAAWASPGSITC